MIKTLIWLSKKILPKKLYLKISLIKHYINEIINFSYLNNEKIFKKIYKKQIWGSDKKFKYYSGSGSHEKKIIVPYIKIIKRFLLKQKIKTLIDFGCGDFNVGKNFVNLTKKYYAYDIYEDLIKHNRKKFKYKNLVFKKKDITSDKISLVDVILVRQVLQHLDNNQIKNFIFNMKNKTKYLIITEHLPKIDGFKYNINKPKGAGLRYNSGVVLHLPPFNLEYIYKKRLLSVNATPDKGKIVTTLYKIN